MRRRRTIGLAAFGAAAALALAACGGSSGGGGSGSGGSGGSSSNAAFNAGITSVVNPSTQKGGTLTFDWRSAPDSFDPGNTYYAAVLGLRPVLLAGPDDLQGLPGRVRQDARAGPGDRARRGQ